MHVLVAALLLGVIAGLRTFTAPTAVSWAARLGRIPLAGTHLGWVGNIVTACILTLLALAEIFFIDPNPKTPSRKGAQGFGARIVMGGFSGAAIGLSGGSLWLGLLLGVVGAVIGTYGGAAFRGRLAAAFGRDLPAAITEDAIAVVGAFLIVAYLA
ncbi:MAG TPA: DUF4126 domain-containing protein [Acidobacteriaceae bacterium]|nr:DUF4126 domain-containing protein [Acidobacteriaceae bacterium]